MKDSRWFAESGCDVWCVVGHDASMSRNCFAMIMDNIALKAFQVFSKGLAYALP